MKQKLTAWLRAWVCRYKGHQIHHIEVWLEPRLTITFCRRCEAISMAMLCSHSARRKRAGGVR